MAGVQIQAGAVFASEDGNVPPSAELSVNLASAGVRGRCRGLAMRLATEDAAQETFEIAVIGENGEVVLALGRFHEEEIVAVWRGLASASGLPLMIQQPDGSLLEPYPQLGPVALGPIRIRRRHGLLSGRRPRFLTRRKIGSRRLGELVYREREIAGGGNA